MSADGNIQLTFDSQLSELLYNKIPENEWNEWLRSGLTDEQFSNILTTRIKSARPSAEVALGIQTIPQLQIWRNGTALYKKGPALTKIRDVMQIPYPEAVKGIPREGEIPNIAPAPAMSHDLTQPPLLEVGPEPSTEIPHGDEFLDKLCLQAHNAKDARVAASNDEREANKARADGIRGKGHEKYLWRAPDGQWWVVVPKLPANPKLVEIKCNANGEPISDQEASKAATEEGDDQSDEEGEE